MKVINFKCKHLFNLINSRLLVNKYVIQNINRNLSFNSKNIENDVENVDIAIFGGGVIGSSVAYWLQQRLPKQIIAVIERDPTYTKCSTTLSVGGIRQQFSIEENIQLSLFSSKFLQSIEKYLSVHDQSGQFGHLPHIGLKLNGYLLLASDSGAEQLIRSHKLQTELGAKIQLMSTKMLKDKFPWINQEGIAIGTYGYENEGWFDPWALLMAFKNKCQSLGVKYINGDIIGFNRRNSEQTNESNSKTETTNEVIFKESDGNIRNLKFNTGVVCCGAYSSTIAKYLGYESETTGVRSVSLPIEPRKRYVYVFQCKGGPEPQSPLVFDTSSVYVRPEGSSGHYLCGRCPEPSDEPNCDDLEVDYSYFESSVWPHLAQRVTAFESIKLKKSWSGLYEYNCLDQNAIIGRDPFYHNIYWATGFSGHGIQMSPAVGMAVTELIVDNKFKTIDLSRFGWNRILNNEPLIEFNIY